MKMVIKDYHTDKIHKFYSDYENFRSIDVEKVMDKERCRHPLFNDTNKFQIHNLQWLYYMKNHLFTLNL